MQNILLETSKTDFISVAEISSKIKKLLEDGIGRVKIKGEISGYKLASSGHAYFNLKDQGGVISATLWRHSMSQVKFKPQDGMEVIVSGKITSYAGQSKYQISADGIEAFGDGAFMQILRQRRIEFEEAGYFDKILKKNIPLFPSRIAIITSKTGAVIQDIIHRITDRCPVNILLWPVAVQGENSANEVATAIKGLNNLSADKIPDVIIIARGGGSIEDLWSFNEEIVIKSAFESKVPIISAIGHETDYTLLDLAADLRAPTPTAAAEFATPVLEDLRHSIHSKFNLIYSRLFLAIKHKQDLLSQYIRILEKPINYFNAYEQKLDDNIFRLTSKIDNIIIKFSSKLAHLNLERINPANYINFKQKLLSNISNNLMMQGVKITHNYEYKINNLGNLLESLDYNKILMRGFAMLQNKEGKYISSVNELKKQSAVSVTLKDGKMDLKVYK